MGTGLHRHPAPGFDARGLWLPAGCVPRAGHLQGWILRCAARGRIQPCSPGKAARRRLRGAASGACVAHGAGALPTGAGMLGIRI